VTVTGSIHGTFPALIRAVFNQPAAKGLTSIGLVTGKSPGLGIASFAVNATLVGPPEARHYDEREAQMVASLRLNDGNMLNSSVDSMNTLDIATANAGATQDDGSVVYQLMGMAAGSVASATTPDVVHFAGTY
jgi:hypothetical protein